MFWGATSLWLKVRNGKEKVWNDCHGHGQKGERKVIIPTNVVGQETVLTKFCLGFVFTLKSLLYFNFLFKRGFDFSWKKNAKYKSKRFMYVFIEIMVLVHKLSQLTSVIWKVQVANSDPNTNTIIYWYRHWQGWQEKCRTVLPNSPASFW